MANSLFVAHESNDNTYSVRGECRGQEFMIHKGLTERREAEDLALALVNLYRAMAAEVAPKTLRLG